MAFRVQWFRVLGSKMGSMVLALGVEYGLQGLGFKGLGFRGLGLRVGGLGFMLPGKGRIEGRR